MVFMKELIKLVRHFWEKNEQARKVEDVIKSESVPAEMRLKIFVSHTKNDELYAKAFIELLESIGVEEEAILSSSLPEYSIPLNNTRYDYFGREFRLNKVFMVYILSEDYYKDVACMNEMGASWVLKNEYTTIKLPGFTGRVQSGAINPSRVGISFDVSDDELKLRLNELRKMIVEWFELGQISDAKWERKRNEFITKMTAHALTVEDCIVKIKRELQCAGMELTKSSIIKLGYSPDVADEVIKQLIRECTIRKKYRRLIWT